MQFKKMAAFKGKIFLMVGIYTCKAGIRTDHRLRKTTPY